MRRQGRWAGRLAAAVGGMLVFTVVGGPVPAAAQMTLERLFGLMDADGDGRISQSEFTGKRKPFSAFDRDGDGYATREEIEAALGAGGPGPGKKLGGSGPGKTIGGSGPSGGDAAPGGGQRAARLPGEIGIRQIDDETRCAISRLPKCPAEAAVRRGLLETRMRTRFPDGVGCRDIDEGWAISYSASRGREYYHGGIDMPAPYDTPIVAAADGTVVAVIGEDIDMRGVQVILRHSPEETGLPFWTYTDYAHLNALPGLKVGDRVRMGQVIGPTGNSGPIPGEANKQRRPAIHFAVRYSQRPEYAVDRFTVVPADGRWMDPLAFYRGRPPFESEALKALPADDKWIPIPVMLEDGTTIPAATKAIWPYLCWR